MNRLSALLADHRPFHSAVQIDRFILGEHGVTPWGIYRQALRELASRWDALKADALAIMEHRCAIETAEDWGVGKVIRAKARSAIETIERTMRDRMREFCRFYAVASSLMPRFEGLTEEVREALDVDEWAARARLKAGRDLIVYGQVSPETRDLVFALPTGSRFDPCEKETRAALIQSARDFEPDLPDISGLIPNHEDFVALLDEEVGKLT